MAKQEYKEFPKWVDHPTQKEKFRGEEVAKKVLVQNAEEEAAVTGAPAAKAPKGGWKKPD